MILFGLISSLTDIILPLFQRYALDHFIGLGVFDTVAMFLALYILTILVAAGSNFISCALATIIEMRVNQTLRQTGFEHLQTLSFSYFNQNSVGYIHARLMSDTSRIGSLVSWTLIDCVWRLSYLVGAVVVMMVLDPGLAAMVLSTGEKQLISFARAVLADPWILILGEATASVDTMTEAKLQNAMESVTAGRTSIMIAHRLSTVRNADMILVVRNGKIVEQGTHDVLLKNKGYYHELYTRQYEDEATAQILA